MVYLDASALVKLVVPEAESVPLKDELTHWREKLTSSIALTEVLRACRSAAAAGLDSGLIESIVHEAQALFEGVVMLDADPPLLRQAGVLHPISMRALDAIHLATALSVAQELGAMITYDRRLAEAARAHNLEVLSPS